ncbi:MAG: mechanosensitive ion channel [Methanospirillum sp.]|uniref:mechanosensitive ion channel family protein n=1 Tax=Methanospirillum sp. TaxID=45200 RepID=UPI00237595FE|nr:mechanosensitive ion channel domain-containing protein [Methanospirillum sp.]MDD1729054.1 mechanosensitive ion channel [Methanospirillum sp.]
MYKSAEHKPDCMPFGNIPAILVIMLGCTLAIILFLAGPRLRSRMESSEGGITRVAISALRIPAVISILAITIFLVLRYVAELPDLVHQIVESPFAQVLYVIIGAFVFAYFLKNFLELYETKISSHTESDFDDKLLHFLQSVYGYVIGIGAFFMILSVLKIDITPLLATGGLVGIIVGLAAQDTFGNFFSGAMIAADQPFREGDRIEIQGVIGDVITVGPRSTRIQTLDSQLVSVPNKILTENMLTNYVLPDISQKVRITIGVGYDSDVELVRSTLLAVAAEGVKEGFVMSEPKPVVYFLNFGASALTFQLLVRTDQYDQTPEVQDYLNTHINHAFKKAGIEIPYPQMDLHHKSSPPHI